MNFYNTKGTRFWRSLEVLFATALLACGLAYGSDNLDYGAPIGGDTNTLFVIDRTGYAVGFDMAHRQPRWVSYRLTSSEVLAGRSARRTDDFREDPLLPPGYVTLYDYRGSGYDRGHLAPAADMGWSEEAMSESFYLSNMSPQHPNFNRGIWMYLESWVRKVAIREGSVVVVSGIIVGDSKKAIGRNRITVPNGYFKAVLSERKPMKAIGFVLPNRGSKESFFAYSCSVDDVERVSGLDLYPSLDYDIQTNIESRVDAAEWIGAGIVVRDAEGTFGSTTP